IRVRFRRRNASPFAAPDDEGFWLTVASVVDGGWKIADRPAGTAVAPPGARRAHTEETIESAGCITLEVAQQGDLPESRGRFHDEVDVIEHDRHGVERPATACRGFQELLEQLLGLWQFDDDGRSLHLFGRNSLKTGNSVLVILARACVFDADGRHGIAG